MPRERATSSDPVHLENLLATAVIERSADVPADIRHLASEHIADFAGVAAAGARSGAFAQLLRYLRPRREPEPGFARVWGEEGFLPARDAAFLNAVAGHIDDFDDDEAELSFAHPTVTALSAAAAAADIVPASGARLVEAYVAGVELIMRLGPLLNPSHYTRGFHATATLGALGAAAAAGVVLNLDARAMRHALGMAASLAGGLRSNFGSDTKALQSGNAARGGVMAAELAREGVSSSEGSLFGPLGFVTVFGGVPGSEESVVGFGRPWLFDRPGLTIKAYPCCTCTHTALDSLFELIAQGPLEPESIRHIEVDVDEAAPRILIHDAARTALEGKFSMPYCLAVGLLRGRLGLAEFGDGLVNDPAVRALMARIAMRPDPSLPKTGGGISLASRLRITFTDGRIVERYAEKPSGSRDHRLSRTRLREKFVANAGGPLGTAAPALFDTLLGINSLCEAARGFDGLCGRPFVPARAS
ncbi:MmgE/PrpD family protein [Ancylobacter sp. MQZ15Z-1]|uniref:MmgE/PrpD family protein n=1 Tax=Ancylobacter mangrovi TaxID=2972472 RepID=A0A9X2PFC3_9HYPH|nr:MmgE/PrpD family protein [Ancylobacter mangrovi]MCS0496915.1 MmgE/PrpD family protein [Ancylobacter mangrovi]